MKQTYPTERLFVACFQLLPLTIAAVADDVYYRFFISSYNAQWSLKNAGSCPVVHLQGHVILFLVADFNALFCPNSAQYTVTKPSMKHLLQ